jgi:hypothetical protein
LFRIFDDYEDISFSVVCFSQMNRDLLFVGMTDSWVTSIDWGIVHLFAGVCFRWSKNMYGRKVSVLSTCYFTRVDRAPPYLSKFEARG